MNKKSHKSIKGQEIYPEEVSVKMAGNLGNMKDIIARIDQARKYESWGSSEPEPSAAYLGAMNIYVNVYSPYSIFQWKVQSFGISI